jgi:hypothetical protein
MHCPPVFGIMGTDRHVVEIAMEEEGRVIDAAEVETVLEQYYATGEVPEWLLSWVNRTFIQT